MTVHIAYSAKLQFERLSPSEQDELAKLFGEASPELKSKVTSFKYLAFRLGDHIVLWRRDAYKLPEILCVIDQSYAQKVQP